MGRFNWFRFLILCSFRNLLRTKRRTFFSLMAVAAATGSILVFESFVQGVKTRFRLNVITSDFGQFQIFAEGYRKDEADDPLSYVIENPDQIKAALEKEIGPIKMWSRRLPFFGLIGFNDRSYGGMGMGIDAKEEQNFLTLTKPKEGVHLANTKPSSIFLGYKLAEKLKLHVGDVATVLVTTATGSVNAVDLDVVGTFKTSIKELDEGAFYLHQETAQSLLKVKGAPRIIMAFDRPNELEVKDAAESFFKKNFPKLEFVHWKELAEFFDNTMGWLEKQVDVFRIIILLIATISIITIFMMGLIERLGEFGTLRAIGTRRMEISAMIFIEAFVQASLGSLLGILVGIFTITVLLRNGITMPPPPLMTEVFFTEFRVPWAAIPGTIVLCTLVAGIAGVIPAFKIARVNIVEALGRNV
jgi:putative ABC transport system permease protein